MSFFSLHRSRDRLITLSPRRRLTPSPSSSKRTEASAPASVSARLTLSPSRRSGGSSAMRGGSRFKGEGRIPSQPSSELRRRRRRARPPPPPPPLPALEAALLRRCTTSSARWGSQSRREPPEEKRRRREKASSRPPARSGTCACTGAPPTPPQAQKDAGTRASPGYPYGPTSGQFSVSFALEIFQTWEKKN